MKQLASVSAVWLAVFLAAPVWAAPTIEAEETAVVFTPGTAGATEVVWMMWAREREGHVTVHSTDARAIVDADGDGVFRYELDRAIPSESVFVAVELSTGEAAVLESGAVAEAEGPGRSDRPRPGRPAVVPGQRDRLLAPGEEELQVLVVRPGSGAWTSVLADGGFGDEDETADGVAEAAIERLVGREVRPAAAGSKPERFEPGDVVVLLDPRQLTATVTRFGPADFPAQD